MGVNYFTKDQIKQLESNPFVKKVSNKAITYTEVFREHFNEEHSLGKLPTQIFIEAGFDAKVLGQVRIDGFAKRVKKMSTRPEGFEDQRAHCSGRARSLDTKRTRRDRVIASSVKNPRPTNRGVKKTNSINRRAAMRRKKNSA